MYLFAPFRTRQRGERYGSAGFGCSASIFDLYLRDADAVEPHVDEVPARFQDGEAKLLDLWNRANERPVVWASLRWLALRKAVIEVYDASEEPFWLIYPVDGHWQADEWDDTSHRVPTLKAALELVFPF